MKDFSKLFARQYSAVNPQCDDDDNAHQQQQQPHQQHQQLIHKPCTVTLLGTSASHAEKPAQSPAVAAMQRAAHNERQQRRKSLKANRSMKPFDVLSTFFNERENKRNTRTPKCAFLLLAIGVLALTTAVLVRIFHPYDMIFKWKLIMADDGEIFNLWAKPPVDLYIKIYLFNITNAEAFLAGREPMNVAQVGPYVYKEIMTHENISFNANNTMSTTPSHPLVWQEHLSEGHREDDEVVMLNIAMLAISHLTAPRPFFVRFALKSLFATSKSLPIVRMTAKEFMFGYPSSLTTLGNTFLPNWISFEKVGLIDRMYDFSSDFETFYTGASNPSISGLYATYRGKTELPQWQGEHCSNIEYASDGTKFKSFIQPNDSVKFFRKSMCRPINLYRVGEERKFGSLKGYNYVFEENAFDNGAINEENKCFCRNGDCQPSGLIDVTDCYYGFPISLSFPHFMNGDPSLQSNITGLKPNPEEHSSAFVIQPESGLPLSLSVKVQINMHFKDLSAYPQVSRFSHLTAPMLWFEIMMPQLPESLDTRFNFYLNILPLLDPIGFWFGLIVGVGLLAYSVTRATLHMSSYARQATNISDSKYARANLLHNLNANGGGHNRVYNPCELKLIEANEKPHKQQQAQHVITRSTEDLLNERRPSVYALELEPVLDSSSGGNNSGSSSDEADNDSVTLTISRNSTASTTSSACMDEAEQSSGNESGGESGGECFVSTEIDDVVSASSATERARKQFDKTSSLASSSGFGSSISASSADSSPILNASNQRNQHQHQHVRLDSNTSTESWLPTSGRHGVEHV